MAATLSHLSPSQHSTSSVSVKEKRRGYLERKNWKNKSRKGKKDDLGLRRPKPVSMRKCLLSRVTTRILWVFCISCLIQKCKEKVLLDKTLVFGEGFRKLLRRTDLNFFPLRTQEATLATESGRLLGQYYQPLVDLLEFMVDITLKWSLFHQNIPEQR